MNKPIAKDNDEWYTLPYAVKPLLEFIPKGSLVLCPFDTEKSYFVKVLEDNGIRARYSHISDGMDFFNYTKQQVKDFDYIISNPPYSIRKQVFEKLEELGKPFAMLVPLVSIALKPIREKLEDKQLLVFDKRIKYKSREGIIAKNSPSETCYLCKGLLPKQIMYRKLGDIDEN